MIPVPSPRGAEVTRLLAVHEKGMDWIVGELYRARSSSFTTDPISHLVFRLTWIETWQAIDSEPIILVMTPVLDIWAASVVKNDTRTMKILPEHGWSRVDIVTLGTAMLRFEFLLKEERKRFEAFKLSPPT